MDDALIGPIIVLGSGLISLAFFAVFMVNSRLERMRLFDLVEKASQEGRTLPPEVFSRMRKRPRDWTGDLRNGFVLAAIGLGMMISGLINFLDSHSAHPELFFGPFKLFPIPALIGAALVLIGWMRKREDDKA